MRHHLLRLCPLVLLFCLLPGAGCRSPDAGPSIEQFPDVESRLAGSLAPLYGRIFSGRQVQFFPAGGWKHIPEQNLWRLNQAVTLFCHVTVPPLSPLTLQLEPGQGPRPDSVRLFWDGTEKEAALAAVTTGGIEITLSAELLETGTHIIRLETSLETLDPRPRSTPETTTPETTISNKLSVTRLVWKHGGQTSALEADEWIHRRQLAEFIALGLMPGSGKVQNYGGFVFDGPGSLLLRRTMTDEARLTALVCNHSAETARFSITSGNGKESVTVAPGGTVPIQTKLEQGDEETQLHVTGAPDGFFLWGEPFLYLPNSPGNTPIVLVTLDTTRRDAIGLDSGRPEDTPALTAFTRTATTFTRAHTTSPWTLPSHASLFTGLYPTRHGAGVSGTRLPRGLTTLAGMLREKNYFTAGFAGGGVMASGRGVGRGFCAYRNPEGKETDAERLTEQAVKFLEHHGEHPFFLFVNYFDPHFPYRAPPAFRARFAVDEGMKSMEPRSDWRAVLEGEGEAFHSVRDGGAPPSNEALNAVKAAYRAEVAFMDEQFGLLLQTLERLGLYDRALIAVAGDHGEFLGEYGFFDHSYRLDEPLTEIPFIVKWPGQSAAETVNFPVSLVDLFPTLLEAAGIDPPATDGLSLHPGNIAALEKRPFILMEEHAEAHIHPLPPANRKVADHLYGLVSKERRLIVWENGKSEHRRTGERWTAVESGPDYLADLARIRRILQNPVSAKVSVPSPVSDEETEMLRDLGYLEE